MSSLSRESRPELGTLLTNMYRYWSTGPIPVVVYLRDAQANDQTSAFIRRRNLED